VLNTVGMFHVTSITKSSLFVFPISLCPERIDLCSVNSGVSVEKLKVGIGGECVVT